MAKLWLWHLWDTLPMDQHELFQIYLKWKMKDYTTRMSLLKLITFMFIYVSYFCWISIKTMWGKGLSLQPLDVYTNLSRWKVAHCILYQTQVTAKTPTFISRHLVALFFEMHNVSLSVQGRKKYLVIQGKGQGSLNRNVFYHRIRQLKRAFGNKKRQAITSTDGGWEYWIGDFILFIFLCVQNFESKGNRRKWREFKNRWGYITHCEDLCLAVSGDKLYISKTPG